MHKKGDEKYLSIWWIAVLALILGGVVISVIRFQSVTDVSSIDAEILTNRLVNCLVDNGNLVFDVSGKIDGSKISELCKIEFGEGKDYFAGIEVYDLSKCEQTSADNLCELRCASEKEIYLEPSQYVYGNLRERCTTLGEIKVTGMPGCASREIYVLGKDGKSYILRVIGGTNEG